MGIRFYIQFWWHFVWSLLFASIISGNKTKPPNARQRFQDLKTTKIDRLKGPFWSILISKILQFSGFIKRGLWNCSTKLHNQGERRKSNYTFKKRPCIFMNLLYSISFQNLVGSPVFKPFFIGCLHGPKFQHCYCVCDHFLLTNL